MRDYALLLVVTLSVMELVNLLPGGTPDDIKLQSIDLLMPLGALILIIQYVPKFIMKMKDSHFRRLLYSMVPLVAILFVLSEFSKDEFTPDKAMGISATYVILMTILMLVSKYLQYRRITKDNQITEKQADMICEESNIIEH